MSALIWVLGHSRTPQFRLYLGKDRKLGVYWLNIKPCVVYLSDFSSSFSGQVTGTCDSLCVSACLHADVCVTGVQGLIDVGNVLFLFFIFCCFYVFSFWRGVLCSMDVIIRNLNSGNSWEGWMVLEGFCICSGPASPSAAGLTEKYNMFQHTPSQQSITPNCRTHIVNNKYPETSYNCNLMSLRFTSICDMLVWSGPNH